MKIEVVFEDFFLESIFNLSEIGGFVLSLFMTSQPAPSDVLPSEINAKQGMLLTQMFTYHVCD